MPRRSVPEGSMPPRSFVGTTPWAGNHHWVSKPPIPHILDHLKKRSTSSAQELRGSTSQLIKPLKN